MGFTRREFLVGSGLVGGAALGGWFRYQRGSATPGVRLRPPGASDNDQDFLAACIRCEKCVEVCPENTLRIAGFADGLGVAAPYVIAREIPCNLCAELDAMRCIEVCPTDALTPLSRREDVRMGLAVVDEDNCVAFAGAICRACLNACPFPNDAIELDDQLQPVVLDACVGCGLCEAACPTDEPSIVIRPASVVRAERERSKPAADSDEGAPA